MSTRSGHRYRVVIDVAPVGAPRQQVTRTLRTLAAARDFVTATRAGIATGTYTPPNAETLDGLSARWLESRRDIRAVTLEGYRHHLAPVLRHLGQRKVQDLTYRDVEKLVAWLEREGGVRGQGLSPRTVKGALIALGQALDMAIREGTVHHNVARLARRPRVRQVVGTDLQHWQPAELQTFVACADEDPLAAAWRLTCCGLTRADVLGLRWSDVNMAEGIVRISQGRVALDNRDRHDHVDDPKSAARRRAIPYEVIWPGTTALLRTLSAQQAADRLRAGTAYTETGLVVVDAIGQPVRPEWYSDRFRAISH
ncbi:MAG: site-specific integrase, partial [Nocardioides sp.]